MIHSATTVMVAVALAVVAPLARVRGEQDAARTQGHARSESKAARDALVNRLDTAFDAAVGNARMQPSEPGVIVAVVIRGQPVFQKAFGLANVEKNVKIGPKTTFELASDTKMMTGYALLMLVERGKVDLGADVRTYLPEFPDHGSKSRVLVEHLAHHSSGLPEYFSVIPEHGGRAYVTNADYGREMAAMKAQYAPRFPPGEKFEYVNTNYMLLGLIIERVTGRSYGQFLKESVFGPLGMKGAWVHERPGITPEDPELGYVNAVGYTRGAGGHYQAAWGAHPDREEELLTVGDGAVWCSIGDMIEWERGLREHKGLSPTTWRMAVTPARLHNGKLNEYGFGMGLGLDNGGALATLSHGGSWGGFLSTYNRDVIHDRTVIVLSNRGDLDIKSFATAIMQALPQSTPERPAANARRG
jgi:CubicO group peptidase (beta-lactamase class C family)